MLLFVVFMWGCVTTGIKSISKPSITFIELDKFCRINNLEYKYSPFYEEIELSRNYLTIKLRPDYSYVLVNDRLQNLCSNVVYKEGKILIPSSLSNFLTVFKREAKGSLSSFMPVTIDTVVIDPGHGGRDPGAISPWGIKEKDVNLIIAKYLYSLLKGRGFRVYLTRDTDVFISLEGRVKFANLRKADLFISIHANANRSGRVSGLEVYYLSPKFNDTQAKVLATAENLCRNEGISLSSSMKNVIGGMLHTENKRETHQLVQAVINAANDLGIDTKKSTGAPFYVLKHNVCPAVLIEVGYLTNRAEEKLLRTSLYKKQLALAIAEGVSSLRDSLKKRVIVER